MAGQGLSVCLFRKGGIASGLVRGELSELGIIANRRWTFSPFVLRLLDLWPLNLLITVLVIARAVHLGVLCYPLLPSFS